MNKLLLRLLLSFSGLWRALGADIVQLRAILTARLLMDDRRPMAIGRQRRKKPTKRGTWRSMFISTITGLMYLVALATFDKPFTALWAYYGIFLFLFSAMLVTDFSSVLIDTRDKFIVLPRPVSGRTLFIARLLHIFIYVFRIALPMSLAGWIYMGITWGWKAALFFPIPILLLVLTALFFVMGLYMLMVVIVPPAKFREVLNYFQIIFSMLLIATYYLVPQLMKVRGFANADVTTHRWGLVLPNAWLASLWQPIIHEPVPHLLWLCIAGITAPFILLAIAVKWLAPGFTARLAEIDTTGEQSTQPTVKKGSKSRGYIRLSNFLNKDSVARAGFQMAWLQSARSRTFRMRVYPAFAYVPIYFLYMIFNSKDNLGEAWHELPHTYKHIFLLYITSFVLIQTLNYITMSDQYKAAWIYYAAPIAQPGRILGGAFKMLVVKYFLPFFLAITAFVVYMWGPAALLDAALAFTNILLFALVISHINYRILPFSYLEQMESKGSRIFKSLFSMLLPALLGVLHWQCLLQAQKFPWVLWLRLPFFALSLLAVLLLWRSYNNTPWRKMKVIGEE